jgi:hypothetical protein
MEQSPRPYTTTTTHTRPAYIHCSLDSDVESCHLTLVAGSPLHDASRVHHFVHRLREHVMHRAAELIATAVHPPEAVLYMLRRVLPCGTSSVTVPCRLVMLKCRALVDAPEWALDAVAEAVLQAVHPACALPHREVCQ